MEQTTVEIDYLIFSLDSRFVGSAYRFHVEEVVEVTVRRLTSNHQEVDSQLISCEVRTRVSMSLPQFPPKFKPLPLYRTYIASNTVQSSRVPRNWQFIVLMILLKFATSTQACRLRPAAFLVRSAIPPRQVAVVQPYKATFVPFQQPQGKLFSTWNDPDSVMDTGYRRPVVQWYPGHIAKAERQLSETLRVVDVVVEVRDARACKATAHPRVGEWCAGRPRIVVLTHLDMIPSKAANAWQQAYENLGAERWDDAPINTEVANQAQQARAIRMQYGAEDSNQPKNTKQSQPPPGGNTSPTAVTPVEHVLFVDAKQGQGIHALHRAIHKSGAHVQERRERRGLNHRPLRVGIIGYPNVGKSALINRILGRKRARTANTPGVTRSLQWIRVRTNNKKGTKDSEYELLDSPGIIPAKMVDQSDALILAACNCIGQAAYDNQAVASYLCEWLKAIHVMDRQDSTAPEWRSKCRQRYGFDPMQQDEDGQYKLTGEDMLYLVADNKCRGDPEDASRRILQDFRAGRWGPISLQIAPEEETDHGQLHIPLGKDEQALKLQEQREFQQELAQQELEDRARQAVETAKERGLELPSFVESGEGPKKDGEVGKGMFEGW